METKGRECEEVKIGEFTYYFITEFRGKEYREIQSRILSEMDLGDKNSPKNNKTIFANIPFLFTLFCLKIDDTEDVKEEFLDSLSMEDYAQVQKKLVGLLTDFFIKIK